MISRRGALWALALLLVSLVLLLATVPHASASDRGCVTDAECMAMYGGTY